MSAARGIFERLDAIEARLDHLEIASQRSLTQGTVYPIVSEVRDMALVIRDRLLAFERRLGALGKE